MYDELTEIQSSMDKALADEILADLKSHGMVRAILAHREVASTIMELRDRGIVAVTDPGVYPGLEGYLPSVRLTLITPPAS